jgi:hypothetical protein
LVRCLRSVSKTKTKTKQGSNIPEWQVIRRYVEKDAFIFAAHGGTWRQSDGTYRTAGDGFKQNAFSGWKRDMCHLVFFLQEPRNPFPNLSYAGTWQPRGSGKVLLPNVYAIMDFRAWFERRAAYELADGTLEDLDEGSLELTCYQTMVRPNPHPHYVFAFKWATIYKVYVCRSFYP